MHRLLRTLFFAAALALVLRPAFAVVVWDESINGPISTNSSAPTTLSLTVGTNSLIMSFGTGGPEFFRFTLPSGMSLASLTLVSYTGADATSFLGVAAASTLAPTGNPGDLLGYTHIGTGPGNVGTNILPSMGTGAGAQGFTPPLGAGTYAFWIQQASGTPTSVQLDFQAIPEPGTVAFIAGFAALVVAGLVRHRRSRPAPARAS